MSRVPDYPPKPPKLIGTLQEYVDAGLSVRSFCSSDSAHSHIVGLQSQIDKRGPGAEVDYAFKVAQTCPTCGASGGGIEIRQI